MLKLESVCVCVWRVGRGSLAIKEKGWSPVSWESLPEKLFSQASPLALMENNIMSSAKSLELATTTSCCELTTSCCELMW